MQKSNDYFVSVKEAARHLAVSTKFIYKKMKDGQLRFQRIGRLRRIRLSDLERWLAGQ